MRATEALGPDGRPLIEITAVERRDNHLALSGTAIAFEATLLIAVLSAEGAEVDNEVIGLEVGGPQRSSWSASLALPEGAAAVRIGEEEMEREGASTRHLREAVLRLADL